MLLVVAGLGAISCGFEMQFRSHTKDGHEKYSEVNYTQLCQSGVEGCGHYAYDELPEELRTVFQTVDSTRDQVYKLCMYYETYDECAAQCLHYCQPSDARTDLHYNLSSKTETNGRPIYYTRENQTVSYPIGYICTLNSPDYTVEIVFGVVCGIIILVFIGLISYELFRRREKRYAAQNRIVAEICEKQRAYSTVQYQVSEEEPLV